MKRRVFLKAVGGVAGAAALGGSGVFADDSALPTGDLPKRTLGRTGASLSVVGFPGLALTKCDQDQGTAALHAAFDRGVNYFDVAPNYGNGDAEIKMGVGLQGLDRSKYFLACKTHNRDKEGARLELERSLQRLKTDHFDLYQLHHLVRPAEVKQVFEPDGAMETILEARKAGKIRHLGFSAHTTKSALDAMNRYRFDTVMFPINFVEYYTRGFGKEVLALANEQGVGVICIKPLSWGTWPKEGKKTREWWYSSVEHPEEIQLAVRFSLSQKGVVTVIPTSFVDLFEKTVLAARQFKPLDSAGAERLQQMASNRESIFLNEEKQVALNSPYWKPVYPGSPHECA